MDTKKIVVSYVPLLYGQPGLHFGKDNIEAIAKQVDESNAGSVDGVAWTLENNKPVPTLIMKQAADIAVHLRSWSENNPKEWFSFQYERKGDQYALVLMPNIEASVKRHDSTMKDIVGEEPEGSKTNVIFRPIHFISTNIQAFDKVENLITDEIQVFAIDRELVSSPEFNSSVLDQRVEIGTFKVVRDGIGKGYLTDLLTDK